jgi:MYXO-CTERM domain-containing protein
MPIPFRFAQKGTKRLINEEVRQEIRAAFFRWTEVTCGGRRTSLRFTEQEMFDGDKPLPLATPPYKSQPADEPFAIFFRDDTWPNPRTQGETIAQTNTNFLPGNGHIRYVDIEINTADFEFSLSDSLEKAQGKKDIQAVITHEVGHYIGLDHSLAPLSIMVAGYCETAQRCSGDVAKSRRLQTDDINAVCALYPPGATYGEDDSSGCQTSPGGTRASWPALAMALGVVVAAVWRRRMFAAR